MTLTYFFKNTHTRMYTHTHTHSHSADGQKAGILTKPLCDWFMPPKMTAATIDFAQFMTSFLKVIVQVTVTAFYFVEERGRALGSLGV